MKVFCKQIFVSILLAVFATGSVSALRPDGWFWNDGEWEWSSEDQFWYWIPPGPPFIQNTQTGQNLPRPINGWLWYDWPYFYSFDNDTWYFIYQGNLPFVFKPSAESAQQWTRWGTPITPPPPIGGPDMVTVDGRQFEMEFVSDDFGNPATANITVDSFRIGQTEVTADLWVEVRNWALENGYDMGGGAWCALEEDEDTMVPVAGLSWFDAVKWCNALSEMMGLEPAYYLDDTLQTVYKTGNESISNDQVDWNATGFRLPTEAEWYLAAIGGAESRSTTFAGGDDLNTVGWYVNNASGGPCSWGVGGISPRAVGLLDPVVLSAGQLFDLSGNVAEWVWNLQRTNPGQPYGESVNPRGPDPEDANATDSRILRGGSWQWPTDAARVASYYTRAPLPGSTIFGFRVVQSGAGSN